MIWKGYIMEKDDFGNRMKAFEKCYESEIDLTKPVIVRVDGKRFSKYTSKIEKPYSMELWTSMYETMNQVCDKIHADIAYYQSDEVTFIFLPKADTGNVSVVFGGRIQKMASVIASMFTAHFAVNVAEHKLNVPEYAYFDARVFNTPSIGEATNNLLWRIKDAERNFVSCVFRHEFGHKLMQGLSGKEMLQYMSDNGVDAKQKYWNAYQSGIVAYKKYVNKETENGLAKRSEYYMMFGSVFSAMDFEDRVKMFQDIIDKVVT